jgi:hypothetical protein
VLHVALDDVVRPCWHGPAIGRVGDDYRALVLRAVALAPAAPSGERSDACPLGPPRGARARGASALEDFEVAAQLSWLIRRPPN